MVPLADHGSIDTLRGSIGPLEAAKELSVDADFNELNAYVYHSAHAAFLDGVIWCLGPFVDDSRSYGVFRVMLALCMRSLVRGWLRLAH